MTFLIAQQANAITDPVGAIAAMVIPILEATVKSVKRSRLERLIGGEANVRLEDLASVFVSGDGDVGICFEYAVHYGILSRNPFIYPIISEALEKFCGLPGGVESILFGPEKRGFSELLESAEGILTDDARVLSGSQGAPPLLKKHLQSIRDAFRNSETRAILPSSIAGIWKADLFLGSRQSARWVATTVKLNARDITWHPGLRVAIYPLTSGGDELRDEDGLVRVPLPYDYQFMHFFYEAFRIVKALLRSRDRLPTPDEVTDPPARYVAEILFKARRMPVRDVLNRLRDIADERLLVSAGGVVLPQKLIVDLDFIRRFTSDRVEQWLKPVDTVDDTGGPMSIGPVPLLT